MLVIPNSKADSKGITFVLVFPNKTLEFKKKKTNLIDFLMSKCLLFESGELTIAGKGYCCKHLTSPEKPLGWPLRG